jgi:hypothetical protein
LSLRFFAIRLKGKVKIRAEPRSNGVIPPKADKEASIKNFPPEDGQE